MPAAWEPRSLANPPDAFGRHWLDVTDWDRSDPARLAVAYLQHRVAQAISRDLEAGAHTLEELAAHVGETPDYVRSKLHGHRPASLLDLMQWAELFGVHILPAIEPANFDDLLP